MVRYSTNAARALAFLKRFYNDIDIYIEDVTCHNMVLIVLKGILGHDVRLTSVNQLGGKEEVVKACKLDQQDDGRKKLYIVDGDLDLLAGRRKPKLKHLYRLRAYCFENLIITERAAIEIASEAEPNTPPAQLAQRLGYPNWITVTTKSLLSLFILYGIARKLAPELMTVGFNVHSLCTQTAGSPVLSGAKIRARMRSVFRQMLGRSDQRAINIARLEIETRANGYNPSDYIISGKDYLLPLLRAKLGAEVRLRGNVDELKVRLARHYDVAREPFLARRLRRIAGV